MTTIRAFKKPDFSMFNDGLNDFLRGNAMPAHGWQQELFLPYAIPLHTTYYPIGLKKVFWRFC